VMGFRDVGYQAAVEGSRLESYIPRPSTMTTTMLARNRSRHLMTPESYNSCVGMTICTDASIRTSYQGLREQSQTSEYREISTSLSWAAP
jgi:hypothetical protein